MFFDRNEIHIQAFLLFIDGKFIIFQSSSPQKHIFQIYTQHIFQKQNLPFIQKNIYFPERFDADNSNEILYMEGRNTWSI